MTAPDSEHDDLVREIHVLRDDMERIAVRMVELSQRLYGKVRREQADSYTARYIVFANAWTRFGSMVEGGIRRTKGVSRIMAGVAREKQEAVEQVEKPVVQRPVETPESDLVELYGEEMVKYAAR